MWLDEIEEWLDEDSIGKVDEYELTRAIGHIERMARVLREQVRYIRVLESTDDPKERLLAFEDICSDDAKELLG